MPLSAFSTAAATTPLSAGLPCSSSCAARATKALTPPRAAASPPPLQLPESLAADDGAAYRASPARPADCLRKRRSGERRGVWHTRRIRSSRSAPAACRVALLLWQQAGKGPTQRRHAAGSPRLFRWARRAERRPTSCAGGRATRRPAAAGPATECNAACLAHWLLGWAANDEVMRRSRRQACIALRCCWGPHMCAQRCQALCGRCGTCPAA